MTLPDPTHCPLDVEGRLALDGAGGSWTLEGRGADLVLRSVDSPSWGRLRRMRRHLPLDPSRADRGLRFADLCIAVETRGRVLAHLGSERSGQRRWPRLSGWLDRLFASAPLRVCWFGRPARAD